MTVNPFLSIVSAGGTAATAAFGIFAYLLLNLLVTAYGIACYVLEGLGLFTIAKRRKLRLYGLAWVPVANYWLLGQIGDHYRTTVKGKKSNLRIWLLVFGIVVGVIALVVSCAVSAMTILLVRAEAGDPRTWSILGTMTILLGVTAALSIVLAIFQFVAYHRVYASCRPDVSTVYTVLSVLFAFIIPFFVFACRKYDDGMTPPVVTGETPPAPASAPELIEAEIVEPTEPTEAPVEPTEPTE